MGRSRGDTTRTLIMQAALEELLPDRYMIYKQAPQGYDDLGFPVKVREAIVFRGTNFIPCRVQEYRVARDARDTLGPDFTQDLHEIIVAIGSPLYVNHIIVVNGEEYEVAKVNHPSELSPYASAIIISLGKVRND